MGWGGVFSPQACALRHTEAVLLVDDSQTELLVLHRVFKQGMGADEQLERTVEQTGVNFLALAFASAACEQSHLHANFLRHFADSLEVLGGKDFGGCHDARLVAIVEGNECGEKCHDSLAAAHVALKQAVHLPSAAHVGTDFPNHTLLRASERKLQVVAVEGVEIFAHTRENVSGQLLRQSLDIL